MTDAQSQLRESIEEMKTCEHYLTTAAARRIVSSWQAALDDCRSDWKKQVAALEQREQELREALAGLLNDPYWQKRIASVEQGFGTATEYGKIVERARAALNPTEPKRVTP